MGAIAAQITSLAIVYSTVYSDADQRKHQSSASLAFVRGIHRRPVNSPHKKHIMHTLAINFAVDNLLTILDEKFSRSFSLHVKFVCIISQSISCRLDKDRRIKNKKAGCLS